MPVSITWVEIAIRLTLTLLAAGAIGFNRDERGHAAGIRTTLLVSLAACIAMIQTNQLLHTAGRSGDSFIMMDLMRLPLGILSGIGFIGAGAIIKRGDAIAGLTTAATLWFVTVMGLCFGGGQLGLGLTSFALGFLTLWALKYLENVLPVRHSASLSVTIPLDGPADKEIEAMLKGAGLGVRNQRIGYESAEVTPHRVYLWNVEWTSRHSDIDPPAVIRELAAYPQIQKMNFVVSR
jgi:putative Mg2+ transporter-C (MgtC) family protein